MKSNELKVLVIGESCTDKFIYCNVARLSPEAPIPVLNPIETIINRGMAANVVANVKALKPNASVTCLTTYSNVTKTRYVDSKSNHMFIRVDEGEDTIEPLHWSNQVIDWCQKFGMCLVRIHVASYEYVHQELKNPVDQSMNKFWQINRVDP